VRLAITISLAAVLAASLPACGDPVRIVSPTRGNAVAVHVVNSPATSGGVARQGEWVNDCQAIPRLSASESRQEWIQRIVRFTQQRTERVASISYPPGDGLETAIVCFSTPAAGR